MRKNYKTLLSYFSPFEWLLWGSSILCITAAFLLGGEFYPLTLIASLIGVTSLTFIAKGNVIGQFLTILFSILYAIISAKFHYWGELLTYLFMALPAAVFASISWLKNPSKKGANEVKVATMTKMKWFFAAFASILATLIFYFILRYFHTQNLWLSTISITTSFFAATLLFLRSRWYAVAYAANDIVLIALWILASLQSLSYLPMVMCFAAFLCNDLYGFVNWKRIERRQSNE